MRPPRKPLQKLTLRDPVLEIIDKQLCSSACVCVELMLQQAIDEKYRPCPYHEKLIRSLKGEGLTLKEISEKTGYSRRQVQRICKLR